MIYEGRYKLITIERKRLDKVFYLLSPSGQIVLLKEPCEAIAQNHSLSPRENSSVPQPIPPRDDESLPRAA